MASTTEERKAKRLKQLQENVEAQILMTDGPEDLLLLATIFLATAKNIFLSNFPKEHTRDVLHKYVDDVTK